MKPSQIQAVLEAVDKKTFHRSGPITEKQGVPNVIET